MLDTALAGVLERLTTADSQPSRWTVLTAFMAYNGADQINYAVLDMAERDRGTARVIQYSTMDPTWIAHYLDTRLDLDDPHVAYARSGQMRPYAFHTGLMPTLASDAERAVIAQAAEAGLRAQISVLAPDPLRPWEPIGGMTIGSSQSPERFYRGLAGREAGLMTAAMMFHSLSIGDVRRERVGARPLSARERDCLTYLALGLRTTRIAERLGITEATVMLHLGNARKKMVARTSAQAAARAVAFGYITI